MNEEQIGQILDATIAQKRVRIKRMDDLLTSTKGIAKRIAERQFRADETRDRFQIFNVSGRINKREEFHSDVIAYILNPKQNHQLKNEPLRLFVDLLNEKIDLLNKENNAPNTKRERIERNSFDDAAVVTEQNRIDILIKNSNGECIIIENKINWAKDQGTQLARYYASQDNVKAVVYLTPHENKAPTPDSLGKDESTQQAVREKLIILPVYPKTQTDTANLSYGWLKAILAQATLTSIDLDILSFLRQYLLLLEQKRGEFMSTEDLFKFLKLIDSEEKLDAAIAIKDMFFNDDRRGNIFGDKICHALHERGKIKGLDAGVWRNCLWIHLWQLSYNDKENFNCEIQIYPRRDGKWQSVELCPQRGITSVELENSCQKWGIAPITPRHDLNRVFYGSQEGLPYFGKETQFYEKVEEIANKILAHKT